MHEVTRILSAIEQGDPKAAEQLLPLVAGQLHNAANHVGEPNRIIPPSESVDRRLNELPIFVVFL